MSKFSIITRGLVKENPTFVLVLGMCPTLATTTSAMNGLEMGLATMFVLILSNIVISLIAPMVPDKVHIPVYIVVIATFVTVLQLLMQAYVPQVYATLGLFIQLIVRDSYEFRPQGIPKLGAAKLTSREEGTTTHSIRVKVSAAVRFIARHLTRFIRFVKANTVGRIKKKKEE